MPLPPTFSEEQYEDCRQKKDFRSMLFEWYRYTGRIAILYASVSPSSSALKSVPPLHFAILTGLLNRCARLMVANIALSHKGYFGETVSILDRCIFESSMKLMWLCKTGTVESFNRYIADGLKTELELKGKINANIAARDQKTQKIEERMLKSIERTFSETGLPQSEILATKPLPDLAAMTSVVYDDRLLYVVGQKIGSHYVHGTFHNLTRFYLKNENGSYSLRDHDCEIKPDQYVFSARFALDAIVSFVQYVSADAEIAHKLSVLPTSIASEIQKVYAELLEDDFEIIN